MLVLAALACRAPDVVSPEPSPVAPATAAHEPRSDAHVAPREDHPDSATRAYFHAPLDRYAWFRRLGVSHESRPIEAHAFRDQGLAATHIARPHVLLLATIHGDEWAGTPLLERLVRELAADTTLLASRDVTVIPVANPDGFVARRRHNARGVDLNRNFPAANARQSVGGTPLSEPESRALHDWLVVARPDLVISIHQPVAVVDWDGPAEDIARVMSEASGLPARRLGSRPGSLGSFLGVDHGVPTITLELPRGAQRLSGDELWERYGATLLRAIESAESQRSTFS